MINLIGSKYPCLKQYSMVPKMFEPLKFDWSLFVHETIDTQKQEYQKMRTAFECSVEK